MKCLNCGKKIVGRPKQARFCSPDCFCAFHNFHKSTGQTFGNCIVCGKPFKKNNSLQKYCSDRCRILASEQRAKERRRETICPQCGKTFENTGSSGRFCSKACVRAHRQGLKKIPPTKPFEQWIDEARQCNLDYGTYRALVERLGKTFDELKAQADSRFYPCHARKHLFL